MMDLGLFSGSKLRTKLDTIAFSEIDLSPKPECVNIDDV